MYELFDNFDINITEWEITEIIPCGDGHARIEFTNRRPLMFKDSQEVDVTLFPSDVPVVLVNYSH
jgi:hypothetical protein